ncbi:MAG TPA: nuclear transport factor 2 family protein [Terriglobales bacterium]|nr:nuclear transport factor 2 family protein [Terriglobales bacterium]
MYRSSSVPSRFQDVETMIRGLTQDLCMAFNTGNYDQVAALFSPEGVSMVPNHPLAEGTRAIEQTSRKLGDEGFEDLRFETERISYSGDIAVETGQYSVVRRQANGTVLPDRGKYVHTWRRLGAWLITVECWNSDLPSIR